MNLSELIKGTDNPAEALKTAEGDYKDAVADDADTASKLPTTQMPKYPDPSPFKIGPMAPGQR